MGSATPITIDFGAIFPFTCVPAYSFPVYASQRPLPDATQDSVRGCWLGFAAVAREPFGTLEWGERLIQKNTLQVGISPWKPRNGAVALRDHRRWHRQQQSENAKTRSISQAHIL